MALHDVDKQGDRRGQPSLNQTDQVVQRMANATTSINPVTDQTSGDYDTPTKGMLQLIATNTTSITTFATGANSSATGSVVVNYPTGIGSPIILAFTQSSSGAYSWLWQGISPESSTSTVASSPIGFTILIQYQTFIDTPGIGKVTFQVKVSNATGSTVGSGGGTYPIRYYIFRESAA
jgi:hypothetical protein